MHEMDTFEPFGRQCIFIRVLDWSTWTDDIHALSLRFGSTSDSSRVHCLRVLVFFQTVMYYKKLFELMGNLQQVKFCASLEQAYRDRYG
jgi:hypothetical protein